MIDALWAKGYYEPASTMQLHGAILKIGDTETAAFARAAEAYRNRAPAPIIVAIAPGPLFTLRSIVDIKRGDPNAFFARRIAAQNHRREAWRSRQRQRIARRTNADGRLFPRPGPSACQSDHGRTVVDHAAHVMDMTIAIDPGPKAGFGEATIVGPKYFDPIIVRSYLYLDPGDPYSPKAEADAKESIRQIPAVGSVRIIEANKLDANGNLPITVNVDDRLPYAIGASAKYSTTEGPASQVYWEDRNVFGGAERLRLSADIFYAPPNDGLVQTWGTFKGDDIGGRLAASFIKPALGGSRNDLLVDVVGERVSTNKQNLIGYTVQDVDGTVAMRHRFSDALSVQAGIEAQRGKTTDILGEIHYTVVGAPYRRPTTRPTASSTPPMASGSTVR